MQDGLGGHHGAVPMVVAAGGLCLTGWLLVVPHSCITTGGKLVVTTEKLRQALNSVSCAGTWTRYLGRYLMVSREPEEQALTPCPDPDCPLKHCLAVSAAGSRKPLDVAVERSLSEIISSQSKSNPQLWPVKLKKLCSFWMENDFSSCLKILAEFDGAGIERSKGHT